MAEINTYLRSVRPAAWFGAVRFLLLQFIRYRLLARVVEVLTIVVHKFCLVFSLPYKGPFYTDPNTTVVALVTIDILAFMVGPLDNAVK